MIKMLSLVISKITPFILLFTGALTVFSFVFLSLDLKFGEDYTEMLGGHTGALIPFIIWMLRTSVGDFDVGTF